MTLAKPARSDHPIPDGWRRVRLGDVAEVNRSNWDPSNGSSIRYLDLTAVSAPGILSPARLVQAADAPSRARRRVASGDILVSTVRPNLRGFARVREASDNLVASTGFAVVTPWDTVDGSFAYHHVMTSQFAAHLIGATTGQAYPAVRPIDVEAYQLLLPPLTEQRAIAAVLDSIDDAIEGAEAVIAATEGLRDALLHDLLTRGLPGRHTEFRDVPGLGTIPADWDVVLLGDVAETITSGSRAWSRHFRTDGALFVRSQNIVKGRIDRSDPVFVSAPNDKEAERTRIREGDILVSITGEPGKATVADEYIGEAYVSQHVAMVRLREPQFSQYVCRSLQSSFGQEQFSRMAYGQTRPGLNLSDIGDANVALAPLAEQQAIATVLDGVDATVEEAWEERDRLRFLKESTADALLAGRVRVDK